MSEAIFPTPLRFFHNKYPNILVSCYRRNTDLLAAGLLKDEYDIIFTWDSTELVKNESIEYRLIERSPLMVASLQQSSTFQAGNPFSGQELHGERLLFMTPSSTGDSVSDLRFYEMIRAADIIRISSSVPTMWSILMMVSIEEGISIIPPYVTVS